MRAAHASLVPVALALVAAFTSANGLMVLPAAALLCALSGRRRQALAWIVAAAVLFAVYFVGYETPGDRTGVIELLREPARMVAFGLVTLGGIGGGPLTAEPKNRNGRGETFGDEVVADDAETHQAPGSAVSRCGVRPSCCSCTSSAGISKCPVGMLVAR